MESTYFSRKGVTSMLNFVLDTLKVTVLELFRRVLFRVTSKYGVTFIVSFDCSLELFVLREPMLMFLVVICGILLFHLMYQCLVQSAWHLNLEENQFLDVVGKLFSYNQVFVLYKL